jgi:aspartyl-tRNA(Asn)/glutamyl-tRNA(Gln) amidotransferase subunit A
MSTPDYHKLSLHELSLRLQKQEVKAVEILDSIFDRIDQVEGRVHSYVTLMREEAFRQAKAADMQLAGGNSQSPLMGIPVALKDNLCTLGVRTTCSSKILENFIPPYSATVVNRLQEAGAVFVGKTNLDEFAMGSSTENSAFDTTRNPWDLDRIPGGSSGGSSAAVAADNCIAALGSDTGGSIRQPAACCGVVGLKPTYGRVSRFGLIAFASSLDQIGPLTKNVMDSALMMNVIAGFDPLDSTSADIPVPDYTQGLEGGVQGMTFGIPKEYFKQGGDEEVSSAVQKAISHLEKLGAKTREISLPHTDYAVATYYILATAEASSNLARYDGVKFGYRTQEAKDLFEMYVKSRAEGFGAEVKRRIMLGTYALSSGYYDAYYAKAQKVRSLIKRDFDQAFQEVDAIVTPTAPTAAFKVGEKVEDPLQMYLSDIFTISVNLAGIPGISLPCGFTSHQLPIGLQLLGKPFDEAGLLKTAFALEREMGCLDKRPPLT